MCVCVYVYIYIYIYMLIYEPKKNIKKKEMKEQGR